jgi:mannosyltransferase
LRVDATPNRQRHDLFSKPSVLFVLFSKPSVIALRRRPADALQRRLRAGGVVWLVGRLGAAAPQRWRALGAVIAHGLLLALLVAPIAPIALRQIPDYENPNIAIVTVTDYLRLNWQAYLGGYAYDPALLGGFADVWLWGVLGVAGWACWLVA